MELARALEQRARAGGGERALTNDDIAQHDEGPLECVDPVALCEELDEQRGIRGRVLSVLPVSAQLSSCRLCSTSSSTTAIPGLTLARMASLLCLGCLDIFWMRESSSCVMSPARQYP